MQKIKEKINSDQIGKRADIAIAEVSSNLSRVKIQQAIKDGNVFLDGALLSSAKTKIVKECVVEVFIDDPEEAVPNPIEMDLDILYEDEDLIVINKAAGMVCHPAPGHHDDTLVNALLYHCKDSLSGIGGVKRPGIVHRLDKDTSGVMVVAKNDFAHNYLANQFANEKGASIRRMYKVIVFGIPNPKCGVIETNIARHPKLRQEMAVVTNGKLAITKYESEKIKYFAGTKAASFINCELFTGRTHQIRVHMKHIGCPVVGDPVYGKRKIELSYPEEFRLFGRQALHSSSLILKHPKSQKSMLFEADLPEDMSKLVNLL